MGLDQYLERSYYIGARYYPDNIKCSIHIERDGITIFSDSDVNEIEYIISHVYTWRKMYGIDNFLNNTGGTVYAEDLQYLLDTVINCIEGRDTSLYNDNTPDKYFFEEMRDTKEMLEKELNNFKDNPNVSWRYTASW